MFELCRLRGCFVSSTDEIKVIYSLLFVLTFDWLNFLLQISLEKGDKGNISAIQEVLTRHQSLAGRAILDNGIMRDLCLEMFKDYQPIMDYVAKRHPNVVEVRLWHKRMLMKIMNMCTVNCHEVKYSDVLSLIPPVYELHFTRMYYFAEYL